MQFLWVYADELIGKGLATHVVLELLLYASARLVNLALPLAILMSSIMTMGSLAEHEELTALKSSGMSLGRILRPLLVTMSLVACLSLLFANYAWPVANLKFRTLLYSVTKKKPTLNLEDGVFYNGIEGYAIRASSVEKETGELNGVIIHQHGGGREGAGLVIRAESGTMKTSRTGRFLHLDLQNGWSYEERMEPGVRQRDRTFPHLTTQFENQRIRIDLSSLDFAKADEALFKRAYEMMSLGQLDLAIDSLEGQRTQAASAMGDFGRRSLDRSSPDEPSIFSADTSTIHADWLARLGPSAERRVLMEPRTCFATRSKRPKTKWMTASPKEHWPIGMPLNGIESCFWPSPVSFCFSSALPSERSSERAGLACPRCSPSFFSWHTMSSPSWASAWFEAVLCRLLGACGWARL